MWKRHVRSAVLAAAVFPSLAQAQAQPVSRWSFEYTGFEKNGLFVADHRVAGSFTGSDDDGDGVIERAEIGRFLWDGFYFDPNDTSFCSPYRCILEDFSYSLDGKLAFTFEWIYSDEMAYSTARTTAGDSIYSYGYVGDGASDSITWNWTDQTRFTINPPPVPEPDRYLLFAAGLLGVGAWRAARSRRDGVGVVPDALKHG